MTVCLLSLNGTIAVCTMAKGFKDIIILGGVIAGWSKHVGWIVCARGHVALSGCRHNWEDSQSGELLYLIAEVQR